MKAALLILLLLAPLPAAAVDDADFALNPQSRLGQNNDTRQALFWKALSADYGEPFARIFERYNRDFYKIDPLLFSPAVIRFNNLRTGRVHAFGRAEPDVLRRSFGGG